MISHKQAATHVLGLEGEILALTPTRLGLVGCGGHAYRNVLPSFRQIPEAVVTAFCDLNAEKAQLYAQTAGANTSSYDDLEQMLEHEELDGVLCVVGFDDVSGEPLYPDLVERILRRGIPVWMEKPPAANADGITRMLAAATSGKTFAQVGFKKVYSPAVQRLGSLIALPEFGQTTQFSYSYGVGLPAQVGNLQSPSGRRFLDDFVHVASVLDYLFGPAAMVQTVRGPSGAGFIVNQYPNGIVGTIRLSDNASGLAPIERLEVIGTGANAVLDNGAFLRYYPPGNRGPYGTSTSYFPPITDSDGPSAGPRTWSPEFSLGNLHGGSHFIQGYYHQAQAFITAVRSKTPPNACGLNDAYRVMTYLDALAGTFGQWRTIPGQNAVNFKHPVDTPQSFSCPRTGRPMALKDGWNYVCRECGRSRCGQTSSTMTCGLA